MFSKHNQKKDVLQYFVHEVSIRGRVLHKKVVRAKFMQVVVLAGGVGSRMRPWTQSIPKPLLPMLDKTLLEHVVGCLPEHLVDEVVVAGGYKVDMIEAYFKEHDVPFDVRIVPEDSPLGTGGALGNCRDVVSGTFACFNGDIISSLDASNLLDLHQRSSSIGTLGLWEVEDPTRFGIVGLDDEQRITRFKEKPTPEEVFSNLINAGSYVFEDDIFDWMPHGKHSIERDIFPKLAAEGLLSGQSFDGYFIDAGTPNAWNDGVQACIKHHRYSKGHVVGDTWFENPAERHKSILQSMVSQGSRVDNASIVRSTLLQDVHIGQDSQINNCLIGRGAQIGASCRLTDVIVDHGAFIPAGTVLESGRWPPEQNA